MRKLTFWTTTALFAGLVAAPASRAADFQETDRVSKLLAETKTLAFQLRDDAVAMEGFTRMSVSWESHATAIARIQDHLTEMEKQVARLNEAKEAAEPWQAAAITRILPFLGELHGYTDAVIEHLNGETKHNFAEYQDYLQANADYATDLAAMIGNFVDYGKAQDRLNRLAEKLELPVR